jgi:hypothetical protein
LPLRKSKKEASKNLVTKSIVVLWNKKPLNPAPVHISKLAYQLNEPSKNLQEQNYKLELELRRLKRSI